MSNFSIPFVINFLPLKLSCVSNFIRKYNCKQIKCACVWSNEMTTVDETKKRESIYTTISKRINEFKIAQNEPDLSIPRRKIEWTRRSIVCFSVGLLTLISLYLLSFVRCFLSSTAFFVFSLFVLFGFVFVFDLSCSAGALRCFTSMYSLQHKGSHSLASSLSLFPFFLFSSLCLALALSLYLCLCVCVSICLSLYHSLLHYGSREATAKMWPGQRMYLLQRIDDVHSRSTHI